MMLDVNTIARPYAKAVFELALEQKALLEWSNELKLFALIAGDKNMQTVLSNPLIPHDQLAGLFFEVAGPLSKRAKNLISLLASRKKLSILGAISKGYDALLAEKERTIGVKVVSAFAIDKARLTKLQKTLQAFLNRQVIMELEVDKTLIGGAVIFAGDQVIDGSLRGKLNRLNERLCS